MRYKKYNDLHQILVNKFLCCFLWNHLDKIHEIYNYSSYGVKIFNETREYNLHGGSTNRYVMLFEATFQTQLILLTLNKYSLFSQPYKIQIF